MVKGKIIHALESKYSPYIVLGAIYVLTISPIVLMFLTSVKTPEEATQPPPAVLPHSFTLQAFRTVLFKSTIPTNLRNSIMITLPTVGLVSFAATLTAYGISRYSFRGSESITYALFATRVIPPISLVVPFFLMFSEIGLVDSKTGLVILYTYLNYPIITFLLKNSFDNFPQDLIDSARVDGATRNQTFVRVVLPIIKISIAAGAIIAFLFTWNEYVYAMVFTQSVSTNPVTVGIFQFVGDEVIEWTRLCAVGVFTTIPTLTFFIVAQRYIVKGLTAGAFKGAA